MKFLRHPLAALAMSAALYAALSTPARAVDKTWVGLDPYPQWDYFFDNNWSPTGAPTGSDNAIFPSSVPSTGSEIYLTNFSSSNPTPIAANLIFNNNWDIIGGTGSAPKSGDPLVSTLTLTQGNVTVNGSAIATIDAIINLPGGTLTKLGTGALVLGQTGGSTLVPKVNGNVTVQQGFLGGQFTMTGNLINNAILAGAGHAIVTGAGVQGSQPTPGNIMVGGNFTQGKTGTLGILLASATSYSKIAVTGSATLAGTASAVYLGGYTPKDGTKFTILTAGGGVKGTFDVVNAPFGGPLLFADYSNRNSVVLTVGGAFGSLLNETGGFTGNQKSVANALDAVAGDPRYAKPINFLFNQGLKNLPNNLNRISPDGISSNHSVGSAASQVQSNNVQGRTEGVRADMVNPGSHGPNGGFSFSAQGLAINGDGPSYSGPFSFHAGMAGPSGDDGKESKEVKTVAPEENRWGAFLSGTGEWVRVGDTENARGYDLASGGFTLGVDYKVTPNFAIGLMGGYIGTGVDLADNGRTLINGGKIGLYATTFVGGWYADTAVTGGYNSYDTRRSALGGDARSSTEGGDLNVLFGTGYDFHAGALTIGPTGSFNYTYTGVNGFTEHGSLLPLQVNGSHNESERMALGFKASYDCKMGGSAIFRPELRAAWQHEFGDVTTSIASSFAAGGGGTFDVTGPAIGRDSLLLGAGFAVQFNERWMTFFYYDGELGRTNYISSAVTGGIRVAF